MKSTTSQSVETLPQPATAELGELVQSPVVGDGEAVSSSPEMTRTIEYTAGGFRKKAAELERALLMNPRVVLDGKDSVFSSENDDSDMAVYARILDNLGEDDSKQLEPHQREALVYMQTLIDLNRAQAMVNLEGHDESQVIQQLASKVGANREKAPESKKKEFSVVLDAMADTYSRLQSKDPVSTGTELAEFMNAVENKEGKEKIGTTHRKLFIAKARNFNDAMTYAVIADKYPRFTPEVTEQSPTAAPVEEERNEALEAANTKLDGLRQQLATVNAKREKRMWGHDGIVGDARHNHKNKALYEEYHAASRSVFQLLNPNLLHDKNLSNTDKIRMIAEHTVEEAKKLDLAILESYRKTNKPLGKLLEKYGKLHIIPKVVLGIGISAAAGVLSGGWLSAPVSGTLMAAGFNARHRKKRAAGANMLSLDVDEIVDSYESIDLSGENAAEEAALVHDSVNSLSRTAFENRIEKAQSRTLKYTLGSMATGIALGTAAHMLPTDGWLNGEHGLLQHDTTHHAIADNVTPSPEAHAPQVVSSVPHENVLELHTGMSDVYAHPNMGMYEAAHNAGFNISQADLLRAAPDLYRYHLAYPMPDGLPGIPTPGAMPQASIDILRYFATHH